MGKKNILRSGFFNADRVTLLTVTAVFAVMAVLVYTGNVGRQIQNMLTSVACYIVLAVSLNLVVGLLGELSLGHAGFMSVGLFTGCTVAVLLQGKLPFEGGFKVGPAEIALIGAAAVVALTAGTMVSAPKA